MGLPLRWGSGGALSIGAPEHPAPPAAQHVATSPGHAWQCTVHSARVSNNGCRHSPQHNAHSTSGDTAFATSVKQIGYTRSYLAGVWSLNRVLISVIAWLDLYRRPNRKRVVATEDATTSGDGFLLGPAANLPRRASR
jgi:hypothetical protein